MLRKPPIAVANGRLENGRSLAATMPVLHHPPAAPSRVLPSNVVTDLVVVSTVTALFFILAAEVELSEGVAAWTQRHESLQLDELPLTLIVLCACLTWFGWRRLRELSREMQARRRAEADMRIAVQQNRQLAHQLLRLQEQERSRIARELHDELAQLCVGIRVEAAGIEQETRGRDLPGVANGARAIRDAVDHLHGVVREMLTRLRPPMLDALGLEASLRALASGWTKRHDIACTVQVTPCCDSLADEVQVTLYRVAQEALTNVARHACAARVELVLESVQDGQALQMTVDDDGQGMSMGGRSGGLGLTGMAERLAALGGSLDLVPSARGGLRVEARLPALQAASRVVEEAPI